MSLEALNVRKTFYHGYLQKVIGEKIEVKEKSKKSVDFLFPVGVNKKNFFQECKEKKIAVNVHLLRICTQRKINDTKVFSKFRSEPKGENLIPILTNGNFKIIKK
jgi:hypothetical protein